MADQATVGSAMKTKMGLVILAVACGGMMVALFAMKKVADERFRKDTDAILDFSNQWVTARFNLDELGQANLRLTNDLAASRQEMLVFSNQFTEATGALAVTRASLQNAQEQVAGLNQRITGLTTQNQVLDQRAAALSSALNALNAQIAQTRQKLAESETNNTFLEKELQRQTSARTELEGKFNNLTTMRSQVKKLKEDLLVSRRLQWMQAGTDPGSPQIKGGQLQMQRAAPTFARAPRYDLYVEVGSDGAIRVMPMSNNSPGPAAHPLP
jgi:peptidoglycan hydrolase CwlO-like protein